MDEAGAPDESALDDRSPFEAAVAVVEAIVRFSDSLPSRTAVWRALIRQREPSFRDYLKTILRTRHSIFYYQMQELYDFGMAWVRPAARENFCLEAGRLFTETFFGENLYRLLQFAMRRPESFQRVVVDMLREYLYRYTGSKYTLSADLGPEAITVSLANRRPGLVIQYMQQHGLDPDRSFRNSFEFIAGAFEDLLFRMVEGFDRSGVTLRLEGQVGRVSFPVRDSDGFRCEALTRNLVGYIDELKVRQEAVVEEGNLERELVIATPLMRDVWNRVRRASRTDEIVLLSGESGTGKTLTARKIHEYSPRREGPFVEVGLTSDLGSENLVLSNLFGHERGAYTGATGQKEGLFSLANGGTIFLDEIGDASPEVQAMLLRVIETSKFRRLGGVRDLHVDVRIIAASNRDLARRVKERLFRSDLYYRLNVIPIDLPPLRRRLDEIPALAEYLLARAILQARCAPRRLAPGVVQRLQLHSWPGNIRELDHALRYALAMAEGDEIQVSDLPETIRAAAEDGLPAGAAPGRSSGRLCAIIDEQALRASVRASDPLSPDLDARPHEVPAHVEFARRVYLSALIDELHGDLALVARFWDRSAEKTLRNLVQRYGLKEKLQEARARRRPPAADA